MEKTFQQHLLPPSISLFACQLRSTIPMKNANPNMRNVPPRILCFSSTPSSESSTAGVVPMKRKRNRYRKQYPGESTGITEELRFVAMKLRNVKGKRYSFDSGSGSDDPQESSNEDTDDGLALDDDEDDGNGVHGDEETWQPSVEGFVKYLVDSKLVFDTVERIVDESQDVSYAYFRKTGLERSGGLSKDLEWFRQMGIVIPEASTPGFSYAKYLEELAEKSAPLFLCHFYNIYFSHIAGGQVIARQASEKLIKGKELEFYRWEGDVQELLKVLREKLNVLGEVDARHWSRDEKNKCLKEATKSFRFLGQMVRLIIL
ncbi:Heme_oxygenase domain-containing protein [Cephalotus follicularis]|uniref:Heme_oxygenase domain-containing protein n=1 Tax=Cephalotus follicularis TaxID=3775 RepID=A0A1Q3CP48_CEPFO|nr:Heme_oxygenase domain-containing protein [Cephalotus follicularis]